MSGAGFILAINLFVAGLLAASFLTVAIYDRTRAAAGWLAFAYLLGMVYYAMESVIPLFGNARPAVVAAFAIFFVATVAFNAGVARRYSAAPPWLLMGCVFAVATFSVYLAQDLPRHAFLRMLAYQAPYFVMQSVAAALVFSAPSRRPIDTLLAVLLSLSALQFMSKPFIAHALGGWGADPQAYLQSNYALVSQTMGTFFALSLALLMLVILVFDLLSDMARKSETDTLSGLLNRRGFEQRAAAAIGRSLERRVPVSLVICDLDHFKAVNDTLGHAAGDKVIETFAQFLRRAAPEHHVAGRIGGEEFAVILPDTNLVAARLFAEGTRSAFSGMPVEGLPRNKRFTASFGVAELAAAETISDLMRRADAALYEAKNSGRDCVKVSTPPLAWKSESARPSDPRLRDMRNA